MYKKSKSSDNKILYAIIICLILLLVISPNDKDKTESHDFDFYKNELKNTFNIDNVHDDIVVLLRFAIVYFVYQFLISHYWIIRRNRKLVKFNFVVIALIVLSDFINTDSYIGKLYDSGLFLLMSSVFIGLSYMAIRVIDSWNLERDLNCWGVRILGAACILSGLFVFLMNGIAMSMMMIMNDSYIVSGNSFFVFALCLIGIGLFCQYRSFRRHGVFVYMR